MDKAVQVAMAALLHLELLVLVHAVSGTSSAGLLTYRCSRSSRGQLWWSWLLLAGPRPLFLRRCGSTASGCIAWSSLLLNALGSLCGTHRPVLTQAALC